MGCTRSQGKTWERGYYLCEGMEMYRAASKEYYKDMERHCETDITIRDLI